MTIISRTIPDVPLTSNGIPIRNLWYMLCYSWKDPSLLNRWRSDVESAPSIDGLLAGILVNLVSRRMRIGLGRSYRKTEETISGVRGRIDFDTSLKKMCFQTASSHCRYEIFDPDVLKNQIIRSTLEWVLKRGEFGKSSNFARQIRQKIRFTLQQLGAVSSIEVRPSIIKRQLMLRDDRDYKLMLTICHLILTLQMPTESYGKDESHELDRSWKYVWRVFESFVANFYKVHLTEWHVQAQRTFAWPTEGDRSQLPAMKPDLVLRHKRSNYRVILDTKLTSKSLNKSQRSDRLTFSSSHTYQLYAYLLSQEQRFGKMTGVLLYPTVQYRLSECVQMQGHHFRWETIDLAKDWHEIESELMDISTRFKQSTPDE